MNTLMNDTETQAGKLPFPAHVKTACPNSDVSDLAREIVSNSRDANNVLNAAGNVHFFVRNHYVDTASGTYGIESLIASILKANDAIFPANVGSTEFRSVAISCAMFADDVITAVRETFGPERYPDQTIRSYLSVFMAKRDSQHKTGKIKLSNSEDQHRTCPKPRTKYFLIEG